MNVIHEESFYENHECVAKARFKLEGTDDNLLSLEITHKIIGKWIYFHLNKPVFSCEMVQVVSEYDPLVVFHQEPYVMVMR